MEMKIREFLKIEELEDGDIRIQGQFVIPTDEEKKANPEMGIATEDSDKKGNVRIQLQ